MERKKVEHVVRAAHNSSCKAMQSRYHLACSSHGSGSLITERARSALARVRTHVHADTRPRIPRYPYFHREDSYLNSAVSPAKLTPRARNRHMRANWQLPFR